MNRLIWVPVLVILGWFAISMTRSLTSVKQATQVIEEERAKSSQDLRVEKDKSTPPTAADAPKSEAVVKADPKVEPFEYRRELSTYTELKSKIFLSDEEKEVRRLLLKHELLMRAIGKRLIEPTASREVLAEQEAGMNLLLEAVKEGNSQVAAEILRDVVEDKQVEDSSLDRAIREQLAGVKAEVLYHWTAFNPAVVGDIRRWLPGPVSQKIWQNVDSLQRSNLAESP